MPLLLLRADDMQHAALADVVVGAVLFVSVEDGVTNVNVAFKVIDVVTTCDFIRGPTAASIATGELLPFLLPWGDTLVTWLLTMTFFLGATYGSVILLTRKEIP